jgi:hypothetical protein
MNAFILTLSFLVLISILTTNEVKHFINASLENIFYENHIHTRQKAENALEKARLEDILSSHEEIDFVDIFHKEKPPITTKKTTPKRPKRSVSLKFNLSRPPNNSRLNLYLVFFGKDSWHYEIAARLIRNLYSGCPDFDSLPGAEYQLLNALTAKKEKMTTLAFPDELASIDLEHENLQHLLYFMLKGGTIKERHFPSFLNFVSFDLKLTNES